MNFLSDGPHHVDNQTNAPQENSFSHLKIMRHVVMSYIHQLNAFKETGFDEKAQHNITAFCGKDSAAGTLIKLCQLQQQLIKLESEMLKKQPAGAEDHISELTEEDWEMLRYAIEQRNATKQEVKSLAMKIAPNTRKKRRWLRSRWARY